MITLDSTLRDVYHNPIGKDMMDRVLAQIGKTPKILANPLVGGMRLRNIEKMLGKKAPGVAEAFIQLCNYETETPPPSPRTIRRQWWKEAVVYQIYPRSFQDSNGDGIGDLAGIRQRIPYLKELGVDMIWLSPIYDSPNDDMGYDVRNYRKIMKEFGNMSSFNALVAELHKNGIKLMMDLVLNHTSDEHEWFQKALENPESPQKDYYIWARGRADGPPNNWTSIFTGPAWNYYAETDEWALHMFSKKQMDLNWDNPAVRAEIYDIVNFWLDKGVDGFRLDVINFISKGTLADGNETMSKFTGVRGLEHLFYGPRLHEYLRELRSETFGKREGIVTVGEMVGLGTEMSAMVTAESRGELDLVFNFDHMDNPGESRQREYEFDLRHLKPHFLKWQQEYNNECWPTLVFENHDNPRMVSKINPDPAWRFVVAKLIAVLQFTLKGTPFLYQGQELGMTNCQFYGIDEMRDVETINRYHEKLADCGGPSEGAHRAFAEVAWGTRDHARTPMQWSNTENAGFTTGEPWLKVNPNFPAINAENEMKNPDSVFHFFKTLIALRRESPALVYGDFRPVFERDKNTFCYFRMGDGEKYYIEINLTGDDCIRPGPITGNHRLVAGNYGGVAGILRPYEANVYKVEA